MSGHEVAPSTHTPELHQLAEIHDCLDAARAHQITVTAGELGVGGVPPAAELDHLSAEGPPDFPYIVGHFRSPAASGPTPDLSVPMHTAGLRLLSQRFHLRQRWGT